MRCCKITVRSIEYVLILLVIVGVNLSILEVVEFASVRQYASVSICEYWSLVYEFDKLLQSAMMLLDRRWDSLIELGSANDAN
jgi:hypothetical protein